MGSADCVKRGRHAQSHMQRQEDSRLVADTLQMARCWARANTAYMICTSSHTTVCNSDVHQRFRGYCEHENSEHV